MSKLTRKEFDKYSGLRKKCHSLKITGVVGKDDAYHNRRIYNVVFKNKTIGEYYVHIMHKYDMVIVLPFLRTSDVK